MKYIIRKGEGETVARLLEHIADAVEHAPQLVTVRDYEETRKLEQNNYYWSMITQVAKWRWEREGHLTPGEVIHEQMKRQFQPVIGSFVEQITVNGQVIEHEQTVHKSTTENSIADMAEYTENVVAFWVDYGVEFEAHRSDMLPSRESDT